MSKETFSAEYINDLVKRSGRSRSTVYRQLNSGWTEAEVIARRRGEIVPESVDDLFPVVTMMPPVTANTSSAKHTGEVDWVSPASVEPPEADDTQFALEWARAVRWAADNLDMPKKAMTRQKAGSAMKYNLYLLGKENLRELHGNLVPRALNILDKHRNPEGGDMARIEDQNVSELEELLKQAIADSQC
jgi:hypothetical protein